MQRPDGGGSQHSAKVETFVQNYLSTKRPWTKETYNLVLRSFLRWAGKGLLDITTEDAFSWVAFQREQLGINGTPQSLTTTVKKVNAMCSIYRALIKAEFTISNPFLAVRESFPSKTGTQKRPTKMLTREQVMKVLDTPPLNTKQGIRDRAIVAVFFGGGIRRSELRELRMCDIQASIEGVTILRLIEAKGGGEESQPIPDWVVEALVPYVAQRKADGASNTDPLWVSYNQWGTVLGQLSLKRLNTRFKEICQEAGIEGATPHCARATYASHLKMAGKDDRDVAQALRHKTVAMVQVYDKRGRGYSQNVGLTLKYK